ncbi:DUF1772 domain-containing protein [Hydrogenophaga sp. 5NK40-0174]|uniref:DUF1772 domain-containing protein n=1 Tax=Hydrogenophaga sp. 5NK40-0174 TaxID=3127649 RepID=UPI00310C61AB
MSDHTTTHTDTPTHALPDSTAALWPHALLILWLGIMAGFFGTYSANINLATLTLDGPTYALIQSEFNRNVRHFVFFIFFFGVLPIGLTALAMGWRDRSTAWWRVTALIVLAYALGIVAFTRAVNLPLNYLTESWTPATLPADWAATRDAWNQANLWRACLNLALFALSLWALISRLTRRQATGE